MENEVLSFLEPELYRGMKKFWIIFGAALVLITACMVYLVRSGVSLRAAPIIRPSIADENLNNVAAATLLRLFPEFQKTDLVLWGLHPGTEETHKLMGLMMAAYEAQYPGRKVHWIPELSEATPEQIANCGNPCWIGLPNSQASEIAPHPDVDSKIKPLGKPYFSMSFLTFNRDVKPTPECIAEKRLTLECLTPLLVSESLRKMKEPEKRYFFVRSYNNKDYFLFLENK